MILALANAASLLVMPFLLMGVIGRVKALWSGRKGPPLLQPVYDALRLLRKGTVYSTASSPLFRIAPPVLLITSIGSAIVVPLLGTRPIASFPFDFVWFVYLWGLGRVALMVAAFDTGSAFEGMGAAREATFSTVLEPALFLVIGALCLFGDTNTLHGAVALNLDGGAAIVVWIASIVTMMIVLQVEAGRMPIDDPTTHLELTMVHEVMVLDHSGPDLAAIQVATAIKFFVVASIIATLLNPWAGADTALTGLVNSALCIGVAIVVGTVESLIARLSLRTVPGYLAVALISGVVALLATTWRSGVAP